MYAFRKEILPVINDRSKYFETFNVLRESAKLFIIAYSDDTLTHPVLLSFLLLSVSCISSSFSSYRHCMQCEITSLCSKITCSHEELSISVLRWSSASDVCYFLLFRLVLVSSLSRIS